LSQTQPFRVSAGAALREEPFLANSAHGGHLWVTGMGWQPPACPALAGVDGTSSSQPCQHHAPHSCSLCSGCRCFYSCWEDLHADVCSQLCVSFCPAQLFFQERVSSEVPTPFHQRPFWGCMTHGDAFPKLSPAFSLHVRLCRVVPPPRKLHALACSASVPTG